MRIKCYKYYTKIRTQHLFSHRIFMFFLQKQNPNNIYIHSIYNIPQYTEVRVKETRHTDISWFEYPEKYNVVSEKWIRNVGWISSSSMSPSYNVFINKLHIVIANKASSSFILKNIWKFNLSSKVALVLLPLTDQLNISQNFFVQ